MDPIRENEYQLIIQAFQQAKPHGNGQPAALRAAVDIAAIGFLRDGLLVTKEAVEARWRDLRCKQDGSGVLAITVPMAGPGREVYISPRTMTALAEMRSAKLALNIDIEQDDRIFQMGSKQLGRRIRNTCSFAGLEGRYGGRSPRLGMAMDLAASSVSMVDSMAAGRWKHSTIVSHFIRKIQPSGGAVAQWHALNRSTDTPE